MRSFLTMLGVIIGIASVVFVVAIGNGAQEKIINIASQDGGLNVVHATPGDDMDSVMKAVPFTLTDLALIEPQPFVNSASPEMMAVGAPLRHDNNKISATLYGVGEQYLQVLEKKCYQVQCLVRLIYSVNHRLLLLIKIHTKRYFLIPKIRSEKLFL